MQQLVLQFYKTNHQDLVHILETDAMISIRPIHLAFLLAIIAYHLLLLVLPSGFHELGLNCQNFTYYYNLRNLCVKLGSPGQKLSFKLKRIHLFQTFSQNLWSQFLKVLSQFYHKQL